MHSREDNAWLESPVVKSVSFAGVVLTDAKRAGSHDVKSEIKF